MDREIFYEKKEKTAEQISFVNFFAFSASLSACGGHFAADEVR